jgi:hypothetical protein
MGAVVVFLSIKTILLEFCSDAIASQQNTYGTGGSMLEEYRNAWEVMRRDLIAWVLIGTIGWLLWLPSFGLVFMSMQKEIGEALSAGRAPRAVLLFDEQRLSLLAKPAAKLFAFGLFYSLLCTMLLFPGLAAAGSLFPELPFLSVCLYLFAVMIFFSLFLVFLLLTHWVPMLQSEGMATGWHALLASFIQVSRTPKESLVQLLSGVVLLFTAGAFCGLPLLLAWPLFWIHRWQGFLRIRGDFEVVA